MKARRIASGVVAASIALSPLQASAGDALAGGIVGAVIGGLIVHEMNKNKQRQRTSAPVRSSKSATASSATREANREVQTALNYFGYNVGTPDGALGPKSRAGISQYQALMGYPPSGQLTDFERTILVSAYQRGMYGGPAAMQVAASHPQGVRGLLLTQRDQMMGVPGAGFAGTMAAAPQPLQQAAPQPTAPAAAPAPAAPGLPNFFGGTTTMASLATHCNKVSLLTSTNGGLVTAATMTDAAFAMSEQFCLARTWTMAEAGDLIAKLPGVTPQAIAEQCAQLGPALQDHVSALSLKGRDEVLQGVSGFVLSSGMAPAQLSATAQICLGSGYMTDAMDVAIGSALLLTVMGERSYAELLGHHLSQGFGTTQRPDLALTWYEMSLDAPGGGLSAALAPGMPDRPDLIRRAAFTLGGKGDRAGAAPAAPALPVFQVPTAPAPGTMAAAPVAPVTQTASASEAVPVTRSGVEALPMAARLPFLLFGN